LEGHHTILKTKYMDVVVPSTSEVKRHTTQLHLNKDDLSWFWHCFMQ